MDSPVFEAQDISLADWSEAGLIRQQPMAIPDLQFFGDFYGFIWCAQQK